LGFRDHVVIVEFLDLGVAHAQAGIIVREARIVAVYLFFDKLP
jgi:hypothetical protein